MTKRKTLTVQLMELQAQYALLLAAQAQPAPTATKSVARSTQTIIRDDIECTKCSGTGVFGQGYKCFACEGKGIQSDADQRRNWGYNQMHSYSNAIKHASNMHLKEADSRVMQKTHNYQPPAPTSEQLSFRERCAAAKAAAMAGGKAVMV